MTREIRLTPQTVQVLRVLLENPRDGLSGAQIAKDVGLASGTLYPILIRLEKAGWLTSEWENGDPVSLGRPRRRFYQVTAVGAKAVRKVSQDLMPAGGASLWA
jgi:DNA-binding PadR family transcriptional regulator